MFIGRNKELEQLSHEYSSDSKSVILIYGKRRIGKSTLIRESTKNFDGAVLYFQCIKSSYIGNVDILSKNVCDLLQYPNVKFNDMMDIITFLGKQKQKILLVLDEYQYLKGSLKSGEMDSIMQGIIDNLPSNIKLILCGSYISIMKELLLESDPLFGRFSLIIHLKEFDYLEASCFLNRYDNYDKIRAYSVFGGSPYVLSTIDDRLSVKENIIKFLLQENSVLATYIENVMLAEIKNTFDIRILQVIGNGKKKYSEILSTLDIPDNGSLDKQLNYLLQMETITKVFPINKKDDKKKSFYEINDNLLRFYFAFVFGKTGTLSMLGANVYYDRYIDDTVLTFISLRFEDVVKQYFSNKAKMGELPGIKNIGYFWYDNSVDKKNGQFDCVLEYDSYYEIFEVKFYTSPMTIGECQKEIKQIKDIPGLNNLEIGFVCSGGFEKKIDGIKYVDLNDLFE